jgi:hypothetical protein
MSYQVVGILFCEWVLLGGCDCELVLVLAWVCPEGGGAAGRPPSRGSWWRAVRWWASTSPSSHGRPHCRGAGFKWVSSGGSKLGPSGPLGSVAGGPRLALLRGRPPLPTPPYPAAGARGMRGEVVRAPGACCVMRPTRQLPSCIPQHALSQHGAWRPPPPQKNREIRPSAPYTISNKS